MMSYLEENNILGDLRGAFRKHKRTEDNIFILKGLCQTRKAKKLKTHLGFIDVSKVFDTEDQNKLF